MSRKTSKEERFLRHLYEEALKKGDPEAEVDRYVVGKHIGEHNKGADHTVQLLTKNGFIKKSEDPFVYLTKRGIDLAKELASL